MTKEMQNLALAPVGNLESYIRAANAWPMLSADEERALAEKLHYHGDLEARSEERRVGKECCPRCRSRWSPYH